MRFPLQAKKVDVFKCIDNVILCGLDGLFEDQERKLKWTSSMIDRAS